MLRITRTASGSAAPAVKLEGKLLEPWIEELAGLFPPGDSEPLPRLDLASLTFVDTAGSQFLQDLIGRGVRIESCAPYIAELLHWVPDSNP